MAWLAVALARVRSICATTRAEATSQTLTKVSRAGSVWRARRELARSAVVVMTSSMAGAPRSPPPPEDPVHHSPGTTRGAQIVVEHLVGPAGPIAQDARDRRALAGVARHLVATA